MKITSKEINELQDCVTSLEAYSMELSASGILSYIQHAKQVTKRAMFLDKFIAKILNNR